MLILHEKISKDNQKNNDMNSKSFFLVYLFIIFLMMPSVAQKDGKVFKVVIDAGHGGTDPGAPGSFSKEKDVALSVALKTGKLISDNCPNVKVIYTRTKDVYPELRQRAKIANDNHADLFISFHCNASTDHSAHGVETYVMGLSKSDANAAVARAENSVILKEADYEKHYNGFNPNSPEAAVMFSLYSSAYLNNSILLADKVQRNLVGATKFTDRGVKQAGYWVLWAVSMPSILIEMGFISNPTEEKVLNDKKSQDDIADAIYRGFYAYYMQMTGNDSSAPEPAKKEEKPEKPVASDNQNHSEPLESKPDKTEPIVSPDGVRFMVQFMALPEKISLNDKRFNGIPKVNRYYEGNLWKYTAGNEPDLQSAKKIQANLKAKYPDAFIIAFKGEEKIPVSEAVKLVK